MQRVNRKAGGIDFDRGSLPFPKHVPQRTKQRDESLQSESGEQVLAAFSEVNRRIDQLARELKCLGYFDDDDDLPRAA